MASSVLVRNSVPLYSQIIEVIKARIESGEIPTDRLPSVRTLAQDLHVNPNTVLRAFRELNRDGIIAGKIGKGTFITTPSQLRQSNREELLHKAINHAIEEAVSLEFSLDQFELAVKNNIQNKFESLCNIKLVFIECNIEQLTYFTRHLDLDSHIIRLPILIDDIRENKQDVIEQIRTADIIVTSFYHLDEIRNIFTDFKIPIVGINLEAEIKTIIEIAKIPSQNTVGIVTTSRQCRTEIRQILRDSNLTFRRILETNSVSPKSIRRVVSASDAVLVSPRKKAIVESLAGNNVKVLEFVFTPDKTSIHNLKVALLEIKKGG